MKNWKTFKTELLKDKEVAKEYEKLAPRYAIISQILIYLSKLRFWKQPQALSAKFLDIPNKKILRIIRGIFFTPKILYICHRWLP